MDYFDDLNPYLVKEDDNENLTRQQTVPPTQPVEQTYVENILRVNVGKKGTFYLVIPVLKHGMIRFIQEHCNKLVEIILLS